MKQIKLTAVERSYLIIELQKNIGDIINKYTKAANAGDPAAQYILLDARFLEHLVNKIRG